MRSVNAYVRSFSPVSFRRRTNFLVRRPAPDRVGLDRTMPDSDDPPDMGCAHRAGFVDRVAVLCAFSGGCSRPI